VVVAAVFVKRILKLDVAGIPDEIVRKYQVAVPLPVGKAGIEIGL
jgi:hypothetical protein